jgi:hypothetical protein
MSNLINGEGITELIELGSILHEIKRLDTDYDKRTKLVYKALYLAAAMNYECGIRAEDKDWPVITIKLPNIGEVAWHCKATSLEYDGHTTEEKFRRINAYIDVVCEKTGLDRDIITE